MKLGELCEVVRGSSPRPKGDPRFYGGTVPRLRVADVTRDGKYVTPQIDFLTEEGAKKSRPMKSGDLVIAVSGNPGLPTILKTDACIHDGFVGLRNLDKTKVLVDYLYRYLLFFKEKINNQAVGAIFKNLTTHQISAIDLPLPPIAEQRRIAAILDKADAVRRKRKEAISLTEELLRSVFLDMFGDLFAFVRPGVKKHPKGFEKCLLGNQITLQRGFDITKSQCQEGLIPVISSGGTSAYHSEAKATGPGVILGRKGSVGRVHYVESDYWPHDTTLWVREFNENNPIFVYYFFKEFPIASFEESTSNPTLNRNRLHPLEIFWPPIKRQEKFSEIFASTMKLQHREKTNLSESYNLFNSLLQRAFRGEL